MSRRPADRFARLSRLFDEAVRLPPEQRDAFVADECADDPELADELRALLEADATGDPDEWMTDVVGREVEALGPGSVSGRRLGSWRIRNVLGEGGMGTVYRAERADGAYEAQAAIKLVRGGMPDAQLTERFRTERQILAGLSHPGVAKLLDGGSTDDGTPFLVMEFVDGEPITDWCDRRGVTVEGRLELFLDVLDAVAHAHGQLVAHRDLKPSNILVTDEGEVKLLDFGVAKLVEDLGDDRGDVTASYGLLTPAYASPEQVAGGRTGVAVDIYALGVLLYELLTGRLPLETRGLTPPELADRVRNEIPPRPSEAVEDPAVARRLRGDLDAVVSRALRKEPEARYASVEAFAEDLRLHLDGRPIRTRRDDWRYRTGKMIRRNSGVVSGAALLLIVGVTFTVNTALQARAVARERDRAEAERQVAERVSDFLEGLFSQADPNQAAPGDLSVRDVLDRGADRLFSDLDADPDVRASLATVMGRVYRAIGAYDAAEPLLDSALALRRRGSTASEEVGDAYAARGALAYDMGEYEAAVADHRRSLEAFREAAAGPSPQIASALDWLAVSLAETGRLEEAEEIARAAVEMYRELDPGPNPDLASALSSFHDLLRTQGHLEEALVVGEEALVMSRAVFGDEHLEVAHALNQMASTLRDLERAEEAVPLVEESLTIRREAYDGPHVEIAASLGNLANILAELGRYDEALERRRASVAMVREVFGEEDHPYIAGTTHSLGALLRQMGRVEEAEATLVDALRLHRSAFAPQHPNVAYPLTELGRLYLETGHPEEARDVLAEAHRLRSSGLPEGHWHVAATALDLGRALDALGATDSAEARLREGYGGLVRQFGPEHERSRVARAALVRHLERRELHDEIRALDAERPATPEG